MFLEVTTRNYRKLVQEYFIDQPELAVWFLKHVPTAHDFRQLTVNERRLIKGRAKKELGQFFAAVQLGELIVKSPHELYGHAYSSSLVGNSFVDEYAGEEQESVTVLCTDVHNEIVARHQLFVGGRSQCSLYPDQIFRYALKNCAAGVIIVHNHPSGSIEPSDNDLLMCQRLERAGNTIGICLLDFIIIGQAHYYSWRENSADL
ncbi:JAB domain-containing protein [Limosilactobacillus caecicola]|uniref:JAB domain-containing protein n=1 Tax=Limosilactobacillus caecicola TaxID=2941332 RepID=UPI002041A59D|nr:JAB domain-containing protein [Limosilactobacillus caecicola]